MTKRNTRKPLQYDGLRVLFVRLSWLAQRRQAFLYGVLSGVVEPIAAVLTIWAAGLVLPVLPYLLSFAAGAMIYVVVEELIPEASTGKHSNLGTLFFAAGFTVMLALDVALA